MDWKEYSEGVRDGLPVGLGYLSVSFGFGTLAASQGMKVLHAAILSASNLTSAGQFAGLTLIIAAASVWEIILTQVVINSRYALMSLALSQRMGQNIGLIPRMLAAFFNTDEIFALAMARQKQLTVTYILGLGFLPFFGWTGGTVLGALAGTLLPMNIRRALGVMLYGMFVAIVIPAAKKEKSVLAAMVLAMVCACLLAWVPGLNRISSGVAIVLATVVAAGVCAVLFPVKEDEQ